MLAAMKLLVLGGTRFVGRAIVAAAVGRGDEVTVVSRGDSGQPQSETRWIRGDRNDPAVLGRLADQQWDAVIDTWSGPAESVRIATEALAESARWYGYVSSRSVYRWPLPPGADESADLVETPADGDAAEPGASYAVVKRQAEIAVTLNFADRSVVARAGLIVGPHEDTGRLTWWLSRAASGGALIAPLPEERLWQYIDSRDLADFLLAAAAEQRAGIFNVVCPKESGVTTRRILDACMAATEHRATVKWVPTETLRRAGIGDWDDLPGWTDPAGESAGLHDCDVSAAVAAGLRCRAIEETVADTWHWLADIAPSRRPPLRDGLPRRGLTAEQEQAVWWLSP
jgi:nucleoside-diphosphate-sugar epimerase